MASAISARLQHQLVYPTTGNLPANPHLQNPPRFPDGTAAPSSASGESALDEKVLRNRLLRHAQFCAVTGSATASLQACHILNTVRRKSNETADVAAARRRDVEAYFNSRGILGGPEFFLNSLLNLVLLKTGIQVSWDKYGSFVFCPSLQAINAAMNHFVRCNKLWQEKTDTDQKIPATRPVTPGNTDCLLVSELDLFVIHPQSFLPCQEPILVSTTPPYVNDSQRDPAIFPPSTWIPYSYDSVTSQLVNVSNQPRTITVRQGQVSIVAIILNAHQKILSAQQNQWPLTPNLVVLLHLTTFFLKEWFFEPELGRSAAPETTISQKSYDMTNTEMSGERINLPAQGQGQGSGSGPASTSTQNTELMQYEELEDEYSDEDEYDRSVSPSEMSMGLEKLVDPSVTLQERMDIGSLLFVKRQQHLPQGSPHW
ncbi:hypothetical protein B0H16DRAFT_1875803 [Mycena metata]|uniref:Uncharacterized protein n=1 Tax=Mycena metata TaxID=1033252 RepID=A0AAD7KH28_9AGAR|nr:hypothetical protein B0H16DRAFT_1875803 [Mycena metata]